jgi:glutamate synthase domain-containing protein 3
MKYEKMTKEELIKKLEEQKHLAKAVNAKDKEIADIRVKAKNMIKEAVDRENMAKEKVNELLTKYSESVTKEVLQKTIEKIEAERDKAVKVASRYIQAYRDYLKLTQHTLNMAISNEELISPKK